MRTIKLKLPSQNNLVTVKAQNLETFGDLKRAIIDEKINVEFDTSKFIVRGTYVEYTNNESALLPQGDLILYVSPVHTKLGSDMPISTFMEMTQTEALEYINTLNYNTIRTFGRDLNKYFDENIVDTSGKFSEMIYSLEDFISKELFNEVQEDIATVPELIARAIENLEQALAHYEENDFVDGVTLNTLREEHERLMSLNRQ